VKAAGLFVFLLLLAGALAVGEKIVIEPSPVVIQQGGSVLIIATCLDSAGRQITPCKPQWSSTNAKVAKVAGAAAFTTAVTGVSVGSAKIRAVQYGVEGSVDVFVVSPSEVAARTACEKDSDCVAAQCCHATGAVNRNYAPKCTGVFCTLECRPGTLDCGAGALKCVDKKCAVVSTKPPTTGGGGGGIGFRERPALRFKVGSEEVLISAEAFAAVTVLLIAFLALLHQFLLRSPGMARRRR
jgi:hypothetical protein